MKYIIELNPDCVDGNFLRMPIRLAGEDQWIKTKASLMPYTEPDISGIENEVWELADYMGRMSLTERDLCFGFSSPQEVTQNLSYQEAKAKYNEWLKQKDEIKVGDEVLHTTGDGVRGVITKVNSDDFYVIDEDGYAYWEASKSYWRKTGRHFSEVAELLKKMRGE